MALVGTMAQLTKSKTINSKDVFFGKILKQFGASPYSAIY